jgi:hypothetical protein
MALGGVFGELIGIRGVFLASGVIVLGAAGVALLMFRGTAEEPVAAPRIPASEAA